MGSPRLTPSRAGRSMTTLLTLVAINTLLFLGLSVAKVVPWPEPLHPRLLRRGEKRLRAGPSTPALSLSLRQRILLGLANLLDRMSPGRARGRTQ